MAERMTLLEARGVTVHYGERMVLDHIDLAVHEREIVTLIGPNGAGKSTLLKVLLGLQKTNHGSVSITPAIRIGYVPQRLHIDPVMPLNVQRFLGLSGIDNAEAIQAALQEVGAAHLPGAQMSTLSGGETQRVLLARALLREPQLLLLDEPLQGVDVLGQDELYDLIARLRDERACGILMASHDLHLVMARTDRVFCLDHQVLCSGHPNRQETNSEVSIPVSAALATYTHHHHHAPQAKGLCSSCQREVKHHG